jgi:hypothetical protein
LTAWPSGPATDVKVPHLDDRPRDAFGRAAGATHRGRRYRDKRRRQYGRG